MNRISRSFATCVLLLFVIALAMASAVTTGQKVKLEGLVVSHEGELVTVRTAKSGNIVLLLTDHTKVVKPEGLILKDNRPMSPRDITPGLWIKFEGVGDSSGHVLAMVVSFSDKDLRIAKAIQGGLTPVETEVQSHRQQLDQHAQRIEQHQEQIQANQQNLQVNQAHLQTLDHRVSELTNYDVKQTAQVYFPSGSAVLSPEANRVLLQLASTASGISGYFILVKGFTDSTGSAADNQDLSMRRAQSVIAFLEQDAKIPLTRVLTPGAMGETQPVSTNATPKGRAENRRVEVTVLVNRGVGIAAGK